MGPGTSSGGPRRDDTRRVPVVVGEREPLTEAEARRVGVAAHQIAKLRDALRGGTVGARGGTLTVQHGGSVSAVIPLNQTSMEAVLALLIEREAALLAGFGVQVEKTQ